MRGAGGNSAGAVKSADGDVYAGADGNVYKKTDDGWQKYHSGVEPGAKPDAAQRAPGTAPTAAPTRTPPGEGKLSGAASGGRAQGLERQGQLEQDHQAAFRRVDAPAAIRLGSASAAEGSVPR